MGVGFSGGEDGDTEDSPLLLSAMLGLNAVTQKQQGLALSCKS